MKYCLTVIHIHGHNPIFPLDDNDEMGEIRFKLFDKMQKAVEERTKKK